MPRLVSIETFEDSRAGEPASAELLVLLGRANRDQGHFDVAFRPLQYSLDLASPQDPIRAEAMVMLGDLASRGGDLESAKRWYERSIEEFPSSSSVLAALTGRGRVRDLLNEPDLAMTDFREAARRLARGDRHPDVTLATMEAILLDRFESSLTQGETWHALRLARLAGSLRPEDQLGARVLTAIAVSAGQVAMDRTNRWKRERRAGIPMNGMRSSSCMPKRAGRIWPQRTQPLRTRSAGRIRCSRRGGISMLPEHNVRRSGC